MLWKGAITKKQLDKVRIKLQQFDVVFCNLLSYRYKSSEEIPLWYPVQEIVWRRWIGGQHHQEQDEDVAPRFWHWAVMVGDSG